MFEVADVNADGRVDLLSLGGIRLAKSGGGFENPQEYCIPSFLPVRAKDINGDQLPDMIAAGAHGKSLQVLLHK